MWQCAMCQCGNVQCANVAMCQCGNVPMCQCGNVPHTQRGGGGWRAAGGRFRAKVWSHWILLLPQAHTQDRYPALRGDEQE